MKNKIIILLIALVIAFIWGHSLMSVEASQSESTGVMAFLQGILDFLNIPLTLTDHFVRKAAHFTEHAAAGLLLGLLIYPRVFKLSDRRMRTEGLFLPFVIGFFIGFIDETIQLFTGRGGLIEDTWLDFFGICSGVAISLAVNYLSARRKSSREDNDTE